MKVQGYCLTCHKIKPIRITATTLAGRTPMGVCDSCEEKKNGS